MPSSLPTQVQRDDTASQHPPPDVDLDITGQLCPMTFVLTRLALDRMRAGQILAVRLRGQEPRANVPASARELGHDVFPLQDDADGTTLLLIRKR